jgi:hypothetical protein
MHLTAKTRYQIALGFAGILASLIATSGRAQSPGVPGGNANFQRLTSITLTDPTLPSDEKASFVSNGFKKGLWTVEPFAFAMSGLDDKPEVDFYGGGVGYNYYVVDDVAVRGEIYGIGVDQTGNDTFGGGFNLFARWHFYSERHWSLFAEGGAGIIQTNVSLPDGRQTNVGDGTHFNFTSHAGVGGTYALSPGTSLVGAFRFSHISNAGISGDDENPGINAIGGYLGINVEF